MGFIKTSFSFMMGTVCGIYVAQNYDVPNIRKMFDAGVSKIKQMEQTYRKSKRKGGDD